METTFCSSTKANKNESRRHSSLNKALNLTSQLWAIQRCYPVTHGADVANCFRVHVSYFFVQVRRLAHSGNNASRTAARKDREQVEWTVKKMSSQCESCTSHHSHSSGAQEQRYSLVFTLDPWKQTTTTTSTSRTSNIFPICFLALNRPLSEKFRSFDKLILVGSCHSFPKCLTWTP